jgi:hypothetical protein
MSAALDNRFARVYHSEWSSTSFLSEPTFSRSTLSIKRPLPVSPARSARIAPRPRVATDDSGDLFGILSNGLAMTKASERPSDAWEAFEHPRLRVPRAGHGRSVPDRRGRGTADPFEKADRASPRGNDSSEFRERGVRIRWCTEERDLDPKSEFVAGAAGGASAQERQPKFAPDQRRRAPPNVTADLSERADRAFSRGKDSGKSGQRRADLHRQTEEEDFQDPSELRFTAPGTVPDSATRAGSGASAQERQSKFAPDQRRRAPPNVTAEI